MQAVEAKTAAQIKEIDRRCVEEFRIPELVLMEHAGEGAARVAMDMNPARRQVVVICGTGNNGGDGFVVARWLKLWNVPVKVWITGKTTGMREGSAAWVNLQIIKRLGIPIEHFMDPSQTKDLKKDFRGAGLVVDSMLGIGLRGEVREPYATIISEINSAGSRVLAVDVPSGLNCDTGEPGGIAVKAAKTVTFIATKPGFDTEQGRKYCGEVIVVDIGVPRELL